MGSTGFTPQNSHSTLSSFSGLDQRDVGVGEVVGVLVGGARIGLTGGFGVLVAQMLGDGEGAAFLQVGLRGEKSGVGCVGWPSQVDSLGVCIMVSFHFVDQSDAVSIQRCRQLLTWAAVSKALLVDTGNTVSGSIGLKLRIRLMMTSPAPTGKLANRAAQTLAWVNTSSSGTTD